MVEALYEVSSQLLFDNINKDGEKYFPFISVIFIFVLFSNLIGLVPYSFTTTSHLIVTFVLAFSIFLGIIFICIKKHKFHMLSLFIPSNTSFGLVLSNCGSDRTVFEFSSSPTSVAGLSGDGSEQQENPNPSGGQEGHSNPQGEQPRVPRVRLPFRPNQGQRNPNPIEAYGDPLDNPDFRELTERLFGGTRGSTHSGTSGNAEENPNVGASDVPEGDTNSGTSGTAEGNAHGGDSDTNSGGTEEGILGTNEGGTEESASGTDEGASTGNSGSSGGRKKPKLNCSKAISTISVLVWFFTTIAFLVLVPECDIKEYISLAFLKYKCFLMQSY